MAMNSVKFRIEGDGTSAIRALNDVKKGMGDVRDIVSKEISGKIKQAFSVAAIEEMTRRTAEWATNLTQTAKHLQITTGELQGFQLAASRIGLDSGKVEGYFTTLEDAAREALKGNMELIKSFGQIGISIEALRSLKPAELFETILKKVPERGNVGFEGLAGIFGRAEAVDIRRLSATMGGLGGEEFGRKAGLTVEDKDLQEITVAWRGVLEGIKRIGVQLLPFVKVILAIVEGIIKMVGGVIGTITGIVGDLGTMAGQLSTGDFKGAWKTFGKMTAGRLTVAGAGIGKAVTLGLADKKIDEWVEPGLKMLERSGMGLTESEKRESEGFGEGLGTVLTFGAGPASKALSYDLKSLIGGLKTGRIAGAEFGGLKTVAGEGVLPNLMQKAMERMSPAAWKNLSEDSIVKFVTEALQGGRTLEEMQPYIARRLGNLREMRLMKTAVRGMGFAGVGLQAGLAGEEELDKRLKSIPPEAPFGGRHPLMNLAFGGGAGGAGSPNLRIGGVFGTDVSMRIVQLNQEMVSILSQMLTVLQGFQSPTQNIYPVGLQ